MSKRYSKKVREYVDSVGGNAHQSAVEIIDALERELDNIRVKVGRRIEVCAQQNGRPECKNCGLCADDIGGEILG